MSDHCIGVAGKCRRPLYLVPIIVVTRYFYRVTRKENKYYDKHETLRN